jgi:formylglycine-generating enzyme required for sulfatase activity
VGTVPYTYRIGKYEIGRDQIFKANTEGGLRIPGVDGSNPQFPTRFVTWNHAARFVNWLNTSKGFPPAYKFAIQPGAPGYNSNQDISLWASGDAGYNPANQFRNSLAKYFLPSVDEWYKAAYYDPISGSYFQYATGSNDAPVAVTSGTAPGTAVYRQTITQGPTNITQAGGLSPYGVMGMTGNVLEWEETAGDTVNDLAAETRGRRGGDWFNSAGHKSERSPDLQPNISGLNTGFRVASALIPEPTSVTLFLLGLLCLLKSVRRSSLN